MKLRLGRPVLFTILLGVALTAASSRAEPEPVEITKEAVEAAWAEVVPKVEEATGVSFEGRIEVRVVEPEVIEEALRRELLPQMRHQRDDEDSAVALANQQASLFARALLAKYAYGEKVVFVCPRTFRLMADLLEEPRLQTAETLRAVLAHEAIHAADDLRHDLAASIGACESFEAISAYSAVIEGHAQHVSRKVCAAAGWTAGFEVFTEGIGALPEIEDESARFFARIVSATITTAYDDGETFIRTLSEKGGPEAVKRAFTEPPEEMTLIFRPEWYLDPSSREESGYDLEGALDLVEEAYPAEAWRAQRTLTTPPQVRAALALLPDDVVDRLLEHWKHNRVLVLVSKEDPQNKSIIASVTEMSNPAEAVHYVAASERLLRLKDEAMKEGGFIQIVGAEYVALRRETWSGVHVEKQMKVAKGDAIRVEGIIAAEGSVAVELLLTGGAPSRDEIDALVSKMFSKLAPTGR